MSKGKSSKIEKLTLKSYYDSLNDPRKVLREKIAEQCGVSMQTVYRWLAGEVSPNKLQREKIAELIGQDVDNIVFGKEVIL